LRERAKQRGLKTITPHQVRHRFATKMLESGATLMETAKLMNHKTIRSTLNYLHTSQEKARAAHERFSQRDIGRTEPQQPRAARAGKRCPKGREGEPNPKGLGRKKRP
jgi:hypothetical protein